MSSFVDKLVDQDIYGHQIGINYKGSGAYKTKLGAFFTLATYVLMCINLITLMQDFVSNERQDEKNTEVYLDRFSAGMFNLTDYQIELALINFSWGPIDENIGRIRVFQSLNCKDGMINCLDRDAESNETSLIELPQGNCSEAKKAELAEFYGARFGEELINSINLVELAQCIDLS